MRIFTGVITVKLIADYTSVEDFGREIDLFNKANEGEIEVVLNIAEYVGDEE